MRDELRRMAAETFGWSQLRDEQLQAMEQVLEDIKDTRAPGAVAATARGIANRGDS